MDFIGTIAIATKAIEGLKLLRGLERPSMKPASRCR
jgi:hypothetical protein